MAGNVEKVDRATLWGGNRSPFSVSYGKMMMWFFLVSDALTFGGFLAMYGFARHAHTGKWPIGEEVFHSFPFLGDGLPLLYVATMTFILIISSVTMVLAVEAGHRNDKKAVIKWLFATIIGGAIFLGSQAWEWSHFIHGQGGYIITESGEKGYLNKIIHLEHHEEVADAHGSSNHGDAHETHGEEAVAHANPFADVTITYNKGLENQTEVSGHDAEVAFNAAARYVHGASLEENEYGPKQFGQCFFFITGFHGFHVFTGVLINIIIFIMVLKGTFDKRGHYEMIEKTGLYWHFVDLVWVFVFTFFYLI